jgi:hypothetical protein
MDGLNGTVAGSVECCVDDAATVIHRLHGGGLGLG